MKLAFQLMADAGLPPQRAKPEGSGVCVCVCVWVCVCICPQPAIINIYLSPLPADLVHKDMKATLRVLYAVFGKYKSRFQQQQQAQASPTPPPTSVV